MALRLLAQWQTPLFTQVTQCQITQFYLCIVHAGLVVCGLETIYPVNFGWIQVFYHISMIYLFTRFYNTSYIKNRSVLAKKTANAEAFLKGGGLDKLSAKPAKEIVEDAEQIVKERLKKKAVKTRPLVQYFKKTMGRFGILYKES